MNELLAQLALPFAPSAITWKPGATKENKCMALAYADLRAYQDRLDEVCGVNWSIEYLSWGNDRIIAQLTIHVDILSPEGRQRITVTRCSTGEMSAQEAKTDNGGTVAEAQAFKRAAAMFGLGRYLYDLPSPWVEFDPQRKRITESGQAELDNRYKTWHAKKLQALAAATTSASEIVAALANGKVYA